MTEEKERAIILFKDFARDWFETYVKANNKAGERRNKEMLLRVHLVPFFGDFYLDEVTSRDIERYKAELVSSGYAPRTVNLHLACLGKLYQCAIDWEVVLKNPVRKVQRSKDRKDKWAFLDFEEAQKFLDGVPPPWKPLFLTAMRTGMRQGEILGLRWEDIDWKRGVIFVRNSLYDEKLYPTKSYASRDVPMTSDLFGTLLNLKQKAKSEYVFPAEDGSSLHRKTLTRPLVTALRKSGVKRIRFHDLRHTYASHLVMAGVPIKTVQELLGHSDLKMTLRYAHLTPQCKKEAVAALEGKILDGTWSKSGHPLVS